MLRSRFNALIIYLLLPLSIATCRTGEIDVFWLSLHWRSWQDLQLSRVMTDGEGSSGGGGARTDAPRPKPRPLITPEPFNGTGSFNDWVDHCEGVAAVNEWDKAAKLLWMRVRLVGSAQTAYGRLPAASKADYDSLRKALKERFEPDSKKELYLSEFSTRKRKTGERWAEYADELRVLSD